MRKATPSQMRGRVFLAFLAMVLQLSKRGKIMERIENRHNLDTQTAIFEEIGNSLSIKCYKNSFCIPLIF